MSIANSLVIKCILAFTKGNSDKYDIKVAKILQILEKLFYYRLVFQIIFCQENYYL